MFKHIIRQWKRRNLYIIFFLITSLSNIQFTKTSKLKEYRTPYHKGSIMSCIYTTNPYITVSSATESSRWDPGPTACAVASTTAPFVWSRTLRHATLRAKTQTPREAVCRWHVSLTCSLPQLASFWPPKHVKRFVSKKELK